MATSANSVLEVRSGGSDTNGGGFVTGASGTDWTLQDAAQYSVVDAVANGTTTITSATANFGSDVVGNWAYVAGGTGSITPGWYEVKTTPLSTSITVDRSAGLTAGTGVTLIIGGALASPGLAAKILTVTGQRAWVKSATYTLTTSTPGSAGPVVITDSINCFMEGYQTTRGDRAARPVVSAGAVGTINIFSLGGASTHRIVNMEADGNSQAAVVGFLAASTRGNIALCKAINCVTGFNTTTQFTSSISYCMAASCTTGFSLGASLGPMLRCHADLCGTGFSNNSSYLIECVATDCTGKGLVAAGTGAQFHACTAEGNTGDGFDFAAFNGFAVGCVSTNNGGYGYNTSAGIVVLDYCASYGNTPSRYNGAPLVDSNPIILGGDPWVDASTDDVRPDATSGEGASLRAIAAVGVFGQTDNRDIGAVQHTDPTQPSANDVQDGVTFNDGNSTGNLVLPDESEVETGVGFGSNGTEFTGTLDAGGGSGGDEDNHIIGAV